MKVINIILLILVFCLTKELLSQKEPAEDLMLKDKDFAIINMYRTKYGPGPAGEVRVKFNNRRITSFKKGMRVKYRIFSEGDLTIKADMVILGNRLPGESSLTLTIKNGNVYFIKFKGKEILFVDKHVGHREFNDHKRFKGGIIYMEEDINIPILKLPEQFVKKELYERKEAREIEIRDEQRFTQQQEYTEYRGDPLKGLDVYTAEKEMEIGNYYALIIGIDKYSGMWHPLKNAVYDAKAVEKLLKEKYRFDHFRTLYDEQATRKNIIKEFEWLVGNVKEKDNVLIYYSGHGDYQKKLNKGYWVPVDARTKSVSEYISNADIQTFLAGIKSKHTLLISDACFSGDIFRGKTVSIPFENTERYYRIVHNLVSRKALTSGGIEPVTDSGTDGHSIFTYYLLKALENNSNKYFDASQLYSIIKIPVINNSQQEPMFSPIKNTGDEGGEFIFIKKN